MPRYDVDTYREAQKEMFGSQSDAGLSRDGNVMTPMINAMLGTDYDSRTEMSAR